MPYVTLMRFEGDPDDLLARKERHLDPVTARVAADNGGLVHLTAKTDGGLLVINVMADAEGGEKVGTNPAVAAALRESGLPQPNRERYNVSRFVVSPGAAQASTG